MLWICVRTDTGMEAIMKHLLFGAAYYDEYMPYDRLEQDITMLKAAGMNVVRIAESTWSTYEPQEGVFDFSHVDRVLDAMEQAGISVIIGTPTYAVPTWMVKSYPEVLAETNRGRGVYGPRQIMDITHPVYLYYAERMIRKLLERTVNRSNVIGFQIDNETKYYGTSGKNVQEQFVKYLRRTFHNDLDEINRKFGLDYWSNRINAWEDFPDVRGTINGSLGAEFQKFQRSLVDEFLSWQAAIVKEYKREDQFITHNFDLGWKGGSYGIQPDVNHFHASQCLDLAGVDIYHPTQDLLTGEEIAFGGDLTRSLKHNNYLLIETEAQGFPDWTPYDGQLRLQAYSHLASGANSVMYWHWHSLHNACETYWKGILSHDLKENAVYRELALVGHEWEQIGSHLVNLKKQNKAAILVSNEALTALAWFPIGNGTEYNDVVRYLYNRLYRMNIECDILGSDATALDAYEFIAVPALYAAPEELLQRLCDYVKNGGHLLATFKTGFADEYVKVSAKEQPANLSECFGVTYQQFTYPKHVFLQSDLFSGTEEERAVQSFMELLMPKTANVLATYEHPAWNRYAAVTGNHYGKGYAVYLGCMTTNSLLDQILLHTLYGTSILAEQEAAVFPVIVRKGINDFGKTIFYYLNYSWEKQKVIYSHTNGTNLLTGNPVMQGSVIELEPWNLQVIEA